MKTELQKVREELVIPAPKNAGRVQMLVLDCGYFRHYPIMHPVTPLIAATVVNDAIRVSNILETTVVVNVDGVTTYVAEMGRLTQVPEFGL